MNNDSVDLIYLDPPFNSNKNYEAPIGSNAEGGSFKDIWTIDDLEQEWIEDIKADNKALHFLLRTVGMIGNKREAEGTMAYLQFMAVRLIEMHRILKPTGSIYLHCDNTMSHYLKLVMDCIFDRDNFRDEVIWNVGSVSGYKSKKRGYIRQNDNILYYIKSNNFTFNKEYLPYREEYIKKMFKGMDSDGRQYRQRGEKKYYADKGGIPIGTNWTDIYSLQTITQSKEKTGYPTQKPLKLLERIIRTSSNKDEVVLDPFCGCATALVAAEKLERQWIGIDVSNKAVDLVNQRMQQESKKAESNIFEYGKGKYNTIVRNDIPVRTDLGKIKKDKNLKKELYDEQKCFCIGCDEFFHIRNLEIDHRLPRSKGGQDNRENFQLLCGWCNRVKGNRPMEHLKSKVRELKESANVYR